MRIIALLVFWQFGMLAGGRLFADVVTLKDGRQISGSVESGNTQELHIKVGDQSQTIDVHQVQAIQFGVSSPSPAAAPPPAKAAAHSAEPAPAVAIAALQGGACAEIGAPANGGGGAAKGTGGVAGTSAGKLTGKGAETAPKTHLINTLTQPALVNSDRGRP